MLFLQSFKVYGCMSKEDNSELQVFITLLIKSLALKEKSREDIPLHFNQAVSLQLAAKTWRWSHKLNPIAFRKVKIVCSLVFLSAKGLLNLLQLSLIT